MTVTLMSPSTFVQPFTSKLTVKAPPLVLKSSALLVIEPAKFLVPNFTLPPALKAATDVGKLGVRFNVISVVLGELVVVSPPVVRDAKSSLNKFEPPPLLGFTVMTRVAVPVPEPFVAEIDTLKVPATVGVPVIAPVDVLTLSPPGNPVALKEVGLPEAVI